MFRTGLAMRVGIAILALGVRALMAQGTAEDQVIKLLAHDRPYHLVSPELFERLGWDLPDGGLTVKALADSTGGAPGPGRDLRRQ